MTDNKDCKIGPIDRRPFDDAAWGRLEQKVDDLHKGVYAPETGILAKLDKTNGRLRKVEGKVWMIIGGLILAASFFGVLEGLTKAVSNGIHP